MPIIYCQCNSTAGSDPSHTKKTRNAAQNAVTRAEREADTQDMFLHPHGHIMCGCTVASNTCLDSLMFERCLNQTLNLKP